MPIDPTKVHFIAYLPLDYTALDQVEKRVAVVDNCGRLVGEAELYVTINGKVELHGIFVDNVFTTGLLNKIANSFSWVKGGASDDESETHTD